MCEVYKLTNLQNGKIYVGITNQGARTRYLHHMYEARSGSSFPIHRAILKYGENNFKQEVLEVCENYELLKEREKYWIKETNSYNRKCGYNLTTGGDGTFGRTHSDATKEKIRQKALGRKRSKDSIERGRAKLIGKIPNNNCAETLRQYNLSRGVKVLRMNLDGSELITYNSYKDAARNNNVTDATIKRMVERPNKKDTFIWKYESAA